MHDNNINIIMCILWSHCACHACIMSDSFILHDHELVIMIILSLFLVALMVMNNFPPKVYIVHAYNILYYKYSVVHGHLNQISKSIKNNI